MEQDKMRTEIIKTKNREIKVKIYNEKSKSAPIIFLPGYNMKPENYAPFLDKLKNKKIYAISPFKSRPKIKSIEEYIELIGQIINNYKIKKFDLVGHSLGGGTAMKANEKLSPRRIVAINPLTETEYKSLEYIKRLLKAGRHKIKKRLPFYTKFIIRLFINFPSLLKLLKDIKSFSLKQIKSPTLILLAEDDEFFSEKNISRKNFNELTLIKTKGRHFNIINFPAGTIKKIIDFLN